MISKEWDIPCGGGQGCSLGFWILFFMIDRVGPKSNIEPIDQIVTKPTKKRDKIEKAKKKWVDD